MEYKRTNFKAADSLFTLSLRINNNRWKSDYAANLCNLGNVYFFMGRWSEADSVFEKSLAYRNSVNDVSSVEYASVLGSMANLNATLGNYDQAERLYNLVLPITTKNSKAQPEIQRVTLSDLGMLYFNIGNYSWAEHYLDQAKALLTDQDQVHTAEYGTCLSNLAGVHRAIGNYVLADTLYERAKKVYEQLPEGTNGGYATIITNQAGLYMMTGNDKAEQLLLTAKAITEKVLGKSHPDYAASLNSLGIFYESKKLFAQADSFYHQSIALLSLPPLNETGAYASALNNFAGLHYKMGETKASLELFNLSKNLRKKIFGVSNTDYAISLLQLASISELSDNDSLAIINIREAVNIILENVRRNFTNLSEKEKLIFCDKNSAVLNVYPSLLSHQKNPPADEIREGFELQIKISGLVLNNGKKVLENARKTLDSISINLLHKWRLHKDVLAQQYALPIRDRSCNLDSVENLATVEEKELNFRSDIFHKIAQKEQINFNDIRKKLGKHEVAIQFVRYQDLYKNSSDSIMYAAYVVLHDDPTPHFVPLCEEAQLTDLLFSNWENNALTDAEVKKIYGDTSHFSRINRQSNGVYDLIWRPLVPFLKKIKKINIAPAGHLLAIAFNALPEDSMHYLIDKYQINQYSSIGEVVTKEKSTRMSRNINVVLFGNPDYDQEFLSPADEMESGNTNGVENVGRAIRGDSWPPLLGTRQEIHEIKELYKQNGIIVTTLEDTAASEFAFKNLSGHSPTILHLATHGFFLVDPEQSSVPAGIESNAFVTARNPLLRSGVILSGANSAWRGLPPRPYKEDGIVTAFEISNMDLSNTDLIVLSACETARGDIKGSEGVFGLQRSIKLAGVKDMILSLWPVKESETSDLMKLMYAYKIKGATTADAFHRAQAKIRKKNNPSSWAAFILIQ